MICASLSVILKSTAFPLRASSTSFMLFLLIIGRFPVRLLHTSSANSLAFACDAVVSGWWYLRWLTHSGLLLLLLLSQSHIWLKDAFLSASLKFNLLCCLWLLPTRPLRDSRSIEWIMDALSIQWFFTLNLAGIHWSITLRLVSFGLESAILSLLLMLFHYLWILFLKIFLTFGKNNVHSGHGRNSRLFRSIKHLWVRINGGFLDLAHLEFSHSFLLYP